MDIIETGHIDARFKHEVNVNFTIEQATKKQRDSRGIDLLLSFNWALDGVGGKRHAPVTLPPVKNPGTHKAGQDGCGQPPTTGIRSPDRRAHSESLYLPSYPGPVAKEGKKV